MSNPLKSTPTAIAIALVALLAAGCASQETSDNAAAGQSDVISQSNPQDQPAESTTAVTLPPTETAQTMPATDATTASTAAQPADSTLTNPTTDTTTSAMVDNNSPQAAPSAAPMASDTNRWSSAGTASTSSTGTTATTTTTDNSGYTTDQPLPARADRN